uniref:MHC class I-like antigen recognition-like domain-containing protein n=1 Tax=Zosterops lateralis melanops TaxID=1220523 RepID=A0A8D2QKX3_ZOSLA
WDPQTPSQLSQFPLSLIPDPSTPKTSVSPHPGVPQFMSIGFVDGIPITRYDSERGRAEPLTQWMKDGVETEYWDSQTQICESSQHVSLLNLKTVQDRYNQSLHTRQQLYGCDLLSNGRVRGSFRIAYDGRDFISFDLGSRRFMAADGAAEITRRCWEHEGIEAERQTNYLKHECPEWLREYVRYGQKELEHKGGWEFGIWEWWIEEHGNSCHNSVGRSHPCPFQWEFHG